MFESLIQIIVIVVLLVIFVIMLYEVVYGYVVCYFGDLIVWQQGWISLNLICYIDLVGIIIILVVIFLFFSGIFFFGYVKLVFVDFNCLCNLKCDMFWVVVVGLGVNLFMVFCWVLMFKLVWLMLVNIFIVLFIEMSKIGIIVNCVLMVFNLILLFFFDGG